MLLSGVVLFVVGVFLGVAVLLAYRFSVVLNRQQEDLQARHHEAEEQRGRLFAVLRSVPDGILVVEDGTVRLANGPAAALWGLAPGEIAGLSLGALRGRGPGIPPPGEGKVGVAGQIYEVTATPVVGGGGRVILFHDVTAARELEQLREDLTHMLVHDLRNPVSSIQMAGQMLESHVPPDSESSEFVQVVQRSAGRLLAMIKDLLDVARLEAGCMPVERHEVPLRALVAAAIEQVMGDATSKEVSVRNGVPATLRVWADAGLSERVVANLVANAVKFSPRQGQVTVSAVRKGDETILTISDEGPGIPPEDQERIFERFAQAGQKRQGGTGLGLTFVKMATEAQGGRVWVESEPGRGSAFHVALPAVSAPAVGAFGWSGEGESSPEVVKQEQETSTIRVV